MTKVLLTIRETADLLNIGESSVRRMVKSGVPQIGFATPTEVDDAD